MLDVKTILMDYLTEPVGVEETPRFGWLAEDDQPGAVQTAYQLQIAREAAFTAPLWDSGWVMSEESAHVEVPQLPLESAARYFARVRIRDNHDQESPWSDTASFVTGLTRREWQGRFITAETPADASNSKGTYLRGETQVQGEVAEAYICATAHGLYHLTLNGQRVGQDEMTPGWTAYDKHLCYQTYDVTGLLRQGENVLGAHLGAGWYKGKMSFTQERNLYGDRTALLANLLIRYADGREQVFATDEGWLGCNSPVEFSEIYDGELYDARLEQPGWDMPGFVPVMDEGFVCPPEVPLDRDLIANPYTPEEIAAQIRTAAAYRHTDVRWHHAMAVDGDLSVLTPQPGCRVGVTEELPVKEVIVTPEGDTVLDFGQNLTGWVRFRVTGQAGDLVHLRCFETLDAKGNAYFANLRTAKAEVRYICRGGSAEYSELFSFQGFRYAKLEAWPGEVRAEDFTACVVHSRMRRTGSFACSHPLVNQLQHNIEWSLKDNFLDIPTDCPQRDERMGWTGDAQIFCRTATFLRNTYPFFRKWLRDVALEQTPEGGVPHVVPNTLQYRGVSDWLLGQGTHSAAAWADVAVVNPWTLYQAYGDKRILADQFDSMRRWIDFMRDHAVNDIWNYKLQFGDWVALDAAEGSYWGATPNDLTCTAYYAYSTGLFVKACRALGRDDLAEEYTVLYDRVVRRFREEFLDERGVMKVQTQTAHIVALYFHLLPEEGVPGTVAGLKRLLAKENGHLVTGFVGTPYFCHALSQNGALDEAYDLLLKEDFPSWLYQVKAGATTVWEHWDGLKPDGTMWSPDMNSFNHYAYGAIGEWLYRVVAGIEIDEQNPGYKHAILAPRPGGSLTWASGSYESVYGTVSTAWEQHQDTVTLTVRVPFNATASIILEEGAQAPESDLSFRRNADGLLEARAGSGTWTVTYTR